jgi:hypothetical protein
LVPIIKFEQKARQGRKKPTCKSLRSLNTRSAPNGVELMSSKEKTNKDTDRIFIDRGISDLKNLMLAEVKRLYRLDAMPTDGMLVAHLFNELSYVTLSVSADNRIALSLTKGGQALLDNLEEDFELDEDDA